MSPKTSDLGPRILVVDDELNIAELISMALRYEGFEVETAGSGSEALKAFESFRPRLIVLDVMLPDFDGFEVARRLGGDALARCRSSSSPRATRPTTRSAGSPSAATTT